MDYFIAPSILSANFAKLGQETKAVLAAGADMIHIDVMDNHYVPNLTIGPLICEALRQDGIDAPLDVHLMTKPVDNLIEMFAKAGATYITIHPEASEHLDRSLKLIKECGCKAGLAFNPATPLDYLEHTIYLLDLVLIMTVNPGFGGQKFIREMAPKIRKTREILNRTNPQILLSVDGGINLVTISEVFNAGANVFVAGSAIFHTKDYKSTLDKLRQTIR